MEEPSPEQKRGIMLLIMLIIVGAVFLLEWLIGVIKSHL